MNPLPHEEIMQVKEAIGELFTQHPLCSRQRLHWMEVPVCILELEVRDSEILLHLIRTIDGHERKGHATHAIKLLQQVSERFRYQISGVVDPVGDKGMREAELVRWYESMGFTVLKGRNITYFPKSLYK